jgi:hypothetical protein
MNNKIKMLILFVILILVLFFIRTIIYNNYIERLSLVKENFQSNNDTNKNAIELNKLNYNTPNNLLNILSNPTLIYSTIIGEVLIFTHNELYIINGKNIKLIQLSDFFDSKYNINNHRENFTGGYFNYKNNTLNVFQNDLILCYSLRDKKTLFTDKKLKYFNNVDVKNAIVYFDKLITFDKNNNLNVLDLNTLQKIEDTQVFDLFKNKPSNMSNCFINFLDIQKGIPIGTPTFIDDGDIYTLDLNDRKLYGPRRIEDGLINNVDNLVMTKSNLNFNVIDSGTYRVFAIGSGIENGGLGGLVFNDIYLKKKDKLSVICGEMGNRIPVKSSSDNNLTNVYSIKLPYNGSCSGSGATIFSVNNDIKLIAGGGGGWSSELVPPPTYCHSEKYSVNNKISNKSKNVVPIRKINISSGLSTHNIRFKIIVTEFSLDVYNIENTKVNVNIVPNQSNLELNTQTLYETDWSEIGEIAQIEFSFDVPITDYRLKLNYTIESTDKSEFANSKVVIIDEQYRKYVIDNFNNTFNYKYITGETIRKFNKPNYKKIDHDKTFISDGYSISNDIKKLNISLSDLKSYEEKIKSLEGENRYIILQGGTGGGGHCYSDRKSTKIISGGGGGYEGGKTMICDLNDEYCGGQGGTSYLDNVYFKGYWYELFEEAFVNNLNNKNGYIVIQRIKNRPKQNEFKPISSKQNNSKTDSNNNYNTAKFFNRNVEKFFSKNSNELDRERIITPLNSLANSSRYDLKSDNLISKNDNMLLKIDVNNKEFDRLCLSIKTINNPFSIMVLGWNPVDFSRYLIDIDSNNYQEDDISHLNHGLDNLTHSNLEKYLELITENNIYRHSNTILNKGDVSKEYSYNLTSMKNFVYYSKKKIHDSKKVNLFNKVIDIKPEYARLYILISFDSKKDTNVNYVFNKFNSKTESTKDIKKRSLFYL